MQHAGGVHGVGGRMQEEAPRSVTKMRWEMAQQLEHLEVGSWKLGVGGWKQAASRKSRKFGETV